MTPFQLAYLNLIRRRVPTLIALIAIAISVACSGVLLRLYFLSGSRFNTIAKGGDVIIGAKAGGIEILLNALNLEGMYPDFLPYVLYESLRAKRPVRFEDGAQEQPNYLTAVIPMVFFGKAGDYRIIGTDDSFFNRPSDTLLFQDGAWTNSAGTAVIGSEVARTKNLKVGDSVAGDPWVSNNASVNAKTPRFNLKVAGVLAPTHTVWDQALFAPLESARDVLRQADLGKQSIWNANVLNFFLVYLEPQGLQPLRDLIDKRTVGQIVVISEARKSLEELTGSGRELGFLMTVLIMLLGGLSVAAMMVTRFEAMTVQLAVMRALGYGRREISRWLVWEGFLLGASACVIGGFLDLIFFPLVRSTLGSALPNEALVPSSIFLSAPVWITAVAATILAVFIPLLRLYRQDVHSSLKGM